MKYQTLADGWLGRAGEIFQNMSLWIGGLWKATIYFALWTGSYCWSTPARPGEFMSWIIYWIHRSSLTFLFLLLWMSLLLSLAVLYLSCSAGFWVLASNGDETDGTGQFSCGTADDNWDVSSTLCLSLIDVDDSETLTCCGWNFLTCRFLKSLRALSAPKTRAMSRYEVYQC